MADLFASSQLGDGFDAVDDDASQPLPGGEDARASQPLDVDGGSPRIRFVCKYGIQHGAVDAFSINAEHGDKAYLGRSMPSSSPSRWG